MLLDHLSALLIGNCDGLILGEARDQVLQVVEGILHELAASDAHFVTNDLHLV